MFIKFSTGIDATPTSEVEAGIVCGGLCPRVGDVPAGVEVLSRLHGRSGGHAQTWGKRQFETCAAKVGLRTGIHLLQIQIRQFFWKIQIQIRSSSGPDPVRNQIQIHTQYQTQTLTWPLPLRATVTNDCFFSFLFVFC